MIWRPIKLTVVGFRGIRDRIEISLNQALTLVVGDNGAGKSSVLNAMEWCLFGSEVARKASGIDERGNWLPLHTSAGVPAPRIEVALTLETGDRSERICVTRTWDQGSRTDTFELLLTEGDRLVDEEARTWLDYQGLPDWGLWRSAFCQHQETARARLLEAKDRSVQIAILLGMEELRKLSAVFEDLSGQAHKHRRIAEAELDHLAETMRAAAQQGANPRADLEADLEQLGFPRVSLGDEAIRRSVTEALEVLRSRMQADDISSEGLVQPFPGGLEVLRDLIEAWPGAVAAAVHELKNRVRKTEGQLRDIEAALGRIAPAETALKTHKDRASHLRRTHGELDSLIPRIRGAEENLSRQSAKLERQNQLEALLRSSADYLSRCDRPDECPVCERSNVGLAADVRARIESLATEVTRDLTAEIRDSKAELTGLRSARSDIEAVGELVSAAEHSLRTVQSGLADLVGTGKANDEEMLEGLRAERKALPVEIQGLRAKCAAWARLPDLGPQGRLLTLYLRWKASAVVSEVEEAPLASRPAYQELQAALDEIAGLCVDLDCLKSIAFDVMGEESKTRLDAVNGGLATQFERIVGSTHGEGLRVVENRTAKKAPTYHLHDGAGNELTPTLNQAALNALSYALLFSQAEHRVSQERPQWLVLDDPGQNLDEAHQVGLAESIRELALKCPVLVGCLPGWLATHLADSVSPPAYKLAVRRTDGTVRPEVCQ